MPIRDYKADAEAIQKWLLHHPEVTPGNRAALKGFLDSYDVKPARIGIFCRQIIHLIKACPDIRRDMLDREKINALFRGFRERMAPATYATVVGVSLRFVRWLNDGEKPSGFRDIKSPPKKNQKRKLVESDMIEWDEAKAIADQAPSVQFKALVMTQLNGGFRPSELIDLRYGDVTPDKQFIKVDVRDGKTGSRQVILYYAVPYLMKWLALHPTKKQNDPLWIMENADKSHPKHPISGSGKVRRYSYEALLKRVRLFAEKAGVKKPMDMYNWRHSCARLLRLWELPVEECANHLGHSVKEFTETYGRLSIEDRKNRHYKAYGLPTEEEEEKARMEDTLLCKRCEYVNEPGSEFCQRCASPLSVKKALDEVDYLEAAFDLMAKAMGDPKTRREYEAFVKRKDAA